MAAGHIHRRWRSGAIALTLVAVALGPGAAGARASGPPIIEGVWSFAIRNESARLGAAINPNGFITSYHFEYTTTDFSACGTPTNPACHRYPPFGDATLPASGGPPSVSALLFGLAPSTTYLYRVVAQNASPGGPQTSPTRSFTTFAAPGPLLPDNRGWEMVSPVQKNGGQVDPPGTIAAGGLLAASAAGGSVTYSSSTSFGGGEGSPPASQYLATRSPSGWQNQNITASLFSGSYGTEDEGVPYQLFSSDLARALLLNGAHCRGKAMGCAVPNPPLAGTEAPEGYQNYYLRDNEAAGFEALLSSADASNLDVDPAHFDLRLAGASPDLRHVVLSSCAALTANATEVALGEGCDPSRQNLYEWSAGSNLALLNLLPAQSQSTPGASLAAQSGAISQDGSHVYFSGTTGAIYLREANQTKLLPETVGGGAAFQTASADGSVAFFTKGSHLYRYDAAGAGTSTDLTSAGGVTGVLGSSSDGTVLYYQDGSGLQRWHAGTTTQVASGADAADSGNWPPTTGTARVSADGAQLLFTSSAPELTGYDNTDLITEAPDSEVYLYDAGAPRLTCVSCNPTGARPIGPSSIPGAVANGTAPGSTDSYKPRVLSSDGRRVFFNSADALVLTDTNTVHATDAGIADAYQWEAQGEGSCSKSGGCVSLISSGRSTQGASFVDASADGGDAFFITDDSLIGEDPGALDLYDARVGGGFPDPPPPIACEGDACQALPPEPIDPTLATLLSGRGNPPVTYVKHCRHGAVKRKGKCVRKHGLHRRKHRGTRR